MDVMSTTVVLKQATVLRGPVTVLAEVDLTIGSQARMGVVGPNGVGKSTLLRTIAGAELLESGSRELAPPEATVGLLPQEPDRTSGETMADFLARRTGVAQAQRVLDAELQRLSDGEDNSYDTALQRWLDLGAADLEQRAAEVCADLGLDLGLLARETTALSGGEAARASLASVLLSRFDVLLLDEPTNDLDFAGLELLERFVLDRRGPLVLVSHDRDFLSRTITSIVDIDQHSAALRTFQGGWDSYLEERRRLQTQTREQFETYADKRQGLVDQAQRQREQSVRGALRAKNKLPDNDRSLRAFKIESATHAASRVQAIESNLRRLEEVEEPRKEWQLKLEIAQAPRSGDLVASLEQAVLTRGDFALGPVDLTVGWADRIVITGPNGGGKSTLLAALLGELPLTSGAQSMGPTVKPGGIDQTRSAFRGDATVLRVLEEATDWPTAQARTLLAKFGLKADHVLRPARTLSPGERTRAGLALLQAVGINLLVLDEPTNHLDLMAIEQLEQALKGYSGTLLLVTHDRRLLDAVSVTRRWAVDDGRVREQSP
jgi:ATPase subunit of ABC transporter with duplicated ATPase domains